MVAKTIVGPRYETALLLLAEIPFSFILLILWQCRIMVIIDAHPYHNTVVWVELYTYHSTRPCPVFYKQNTEIFIDSYQNAVYSVMKIQILILILILIPDTLYSVLIL